MNNGITNDEGNAMLTFIEKLAEVDDTLAYLEDFIKGTDGDFITQVRGKLNDLIENIASQFQQEWIPVEMRLPKENVGVLVFIPEEDNHITSGMWDVSKKWVLLDEYRTVSDDAPVTHWMLLPPLPQPYNPKQP
jgi:hypothetical protein